MNLKQDFEYNKQELDSLLISINRTIEGNLRILDFTGNKPRPGSEREFDSLMNFIAVTEQFFPRNGFLDDLLNSGKLGIFKNVELRNRLSLWKPIIEDISKSENSSLEFDYVLIDFVIKNGGWLNVDQVIQSTLDVSFPKSGFDIDNRGLLDFIEFENMVENRIIFLNKLRSRLREAETLIAQILDLLNREIA